MKPAKAITRFFVLLALSYTLLMLLRPVLRPTYARLFRAGNEFLLGSFGRDGVVHFIATEKASDDHDCRLILGNRRVRRTAWTEFSSDLGYVPSGFLTALLIATPLPFRRKAWAWLWGMLLLHAVFAVTLALHITLVFSSNPRVALFSLPEFWQQPLIEAERLVLFMPFFRKVVATFVWVLVTFRSEDIATIARGKRRPRNLSV